MRIRIAASLAALVLLTPLAASAASVSELLALIQQLQAQIAALKAQNMPNANANPVAQCISLIHSFSVDDTDADTDGEVTKLQQFLASLGASIYPEARITGYFGPATMRALQRWQKLKGIVSSGDPDSTGYGFVGAKTRAALACKSAYTPASENASPWASPYVPPPSQIVVSDAPTISFFTATPSAVSAGQAVTLAWASNAANCHLWKAAANGGFDAIVNNAGSATSNVVYPAESATYVLNCFYPVQSNGKDGPSTMKKVYVSVTAQPMPSVSLSASLSSIIVGQTSMLTWSSTNANRCTLQGLNQYSPFTETVPVTGSKVVTPSQTTSYRIICVNDPGNGKDGPSAEQMTTVTVINPTHVFSGTGVSVNSGPNAVAYMAAVNVVPGSSFNVAGTATENSTLTVALVEVAYAGSKDWQSVSQLLKDGSGYRAVSNSTTAANGSWSASFGGLPEGYYHLLIYDASYNLKGSGFLVASWKG